MVKKKSNISVNLSPSLSLSVPHTTGKRLTLDPHHRRRPLIQSRAISLCFSDFRLALQGVPLGERVGHPIPHELREIRT